MGVSLFSVLVLFLVFMLCCCFLLAVDVGVVRSPSLPLPAHCCIYVLLFTFLCISLILFCSFFVFASFTGPRFANWNFVFSKRNVVSACLPACPTTTTTTMAVRDGGFGVCGRF